MNLAFEALWAWAIHRGRLTSATAAAAAVFELYVLQTREACSTDPSATGEPVLPVRPAVGRTGRLMGARGSRVIARNAVSGERYLRWRGQFNCLDDRRTCYGKRESPEQAHERTAAMSVA